ncbi:hypothetical protein LJC04_02425 [Ruminococcaceae bacterium OttesenSCG-928-O06]|nr:hypothetical protein [Ruminococcaceae bacterium OttesenSCG-928-O06]
MDIAVVSCREWQHKIDEDTWLCQALQALGHTARIAAWDDATVNWGAFAGAVMRSAWGYQHNMPAFLRWLAVLKESGVSLLNPPEILLANVYKHRQFALLQAAGLPVIPSYFVSAGGGPHLAAAAPTLAQTLAAGFAGQCGPFVMKPIVSASGHNTVRVNPAPTAENEALFHTLLSAKDSVGVILQPFVPEVAAGELALVFFGGAYSHCVRRFTAVLTTRAKDAHTDTPSPAALALAQSTLAALGTPPPVYARVDLVETPAGPLLMEVELAEPFLFLDKLPENTRTTAATRFAAAVAARLQSTTGER